MASFHGTIQSHRFLLWHDSRNCISFISLCKQCLRGGISYFYRCYLVILITEMAELSHSSIKL
jgi:hypothetical protein